MRRDEQRFCLAIALISVLLGIYYLFCGEYEQARYPTLLWICMLNQYRVSKVEEDNHNHHSHNEEPTEFQRWD